MNTMDVLLDEQTTVSTPFEAVVEAAALKNYAAKQTRPKI